MWWSALSPWPGVPATISASLPLGHGSLSLADAGFRALGSWHALALLLLAKADWEEIMKALVPNHPVPAKCPYLRCYLHSRTPPESGRNWLWPEISPSHDFFPSPVGFPIPRLPRRNLALIICMCNGVSTSASGASSLRQEFQLMVF